MWRWEYGKTTVVLAAINQSVLNGFEGGVTNFAFCLSGEVDDNYFVRCCSFDYLVCGVFGGRVRKEQDVLEMFQDVST